MNIQIYVNHVEGTDEDLLVKKIFDTTVCTLLLSYVTKERVLIITLYVNVTRVYCLWFR